MNRKPTRNQIELMAPAGSFESLQAAIQGGADAVYFGIENLNMRSRSSHNFRLEDLEIISEICRENSIRSYLTLNIVLYDDEIDEAKRVIDKAKETGITAVILSDQSVIEYAAQQKVEIHLSTQLNISNIESLKFYSSYADVVVLARELDLEKVANIANGIQEGPIVGPSGAPVKLEMFVHGALCMGISGKCYLSLHEMDASANRGECLQTCRKGYRVTNKDTGYELDLENEYIMSPKDLKTIHFLNKILDTGVRVLKIEGRARSAEYVKTVTSCYNEAIDAHCEDSFTEEKIEDWDKRLGSVFNRGFWDGYYLGQRLGEWSHRYGSRATKRKVYAGKVTNYFSNQKVAEVLIETGTLSVEDTILVIGSTTGVVEARVDELRVDDLNEKIARKGERCSIPMTVPVRRNDKIYRWVDADKVKQQ